MATGRQNWLLVPPAVEGKVTPLHFMVGALPRVSVSASETRLMKTKRSAFMRERRIIRIKSKRTTPLVPICLPHKWFLFPGPKVALRDYLCGSCERLAGVLPSLGQLRVDTRPRDNQVIVILCYFGLKNSCRTLEVRVWLFLEYGSF